MNGLPAAYCQLSLHLASGEPTIASSNYGLSPILQPRRSATDCGQHQHLDQ